MDWDQDFREYGTDWSEEAEWATMDYNTETGNLFICDTLEELAEAMGVPTDRFLATVERYNALAEKGYDEDFGKRSELMTTISEGPFYGLRMYTGLCDIPAPDRFRRALSIRLALLGIKPVTASACVS